MLIKRFIYAYKVILGYFPVLEVGGTYINKNATENNTILREVSEVSSGKFIISTLNKKGIITGVCEMGRELSISEVIHFMANSNMVKIKE